MMKNILYSLALVTLFSFGCTKDFEQINSNPNAPIQVQPEFLLRQVIYNYGEQMSFEGYAAGNLLGQYFTAVDFNLFDRHSLSEPQFGGNPWPILYKSLRDNELILDRARSSKSFEVYEGPALIMKAYMTAALTDIFGDVPYSQALQGKDGLISPIYDKQEEIYTGTDGILANLDAGIEKIRNYNGLELLKGDILFNGDLSSWITFANSLKIKSLMRISSKMNVSSQLQAIYNEGNYIKTNDQNAVFNFTSNQPNNFRMATARVGDFNLFVLSKTMEEVLKAYKDPRIATFYRPALLTGEFEGLLNGPNASTTSIKLANYSLTGEIFRENTGALDANFITAWEIRFLLSEAAQKALIFANPKTLYEEGVEMAFEYWNTALPTDYLTSGATAFSNDNETRLEQTITQKWIANTINGFEGWIEYRRTGYPRLKTVLASLNNDLIPVRMPYPIDEEALNGENFGKASSATNGNSINAPVWWDN